MKGIIAKKSTKFMGCLKNLHFLGEQMNLTRYSIRKNKTITFSENKTKSVQRQPFKMLITLALTKIDVKFSKYIIDIKKQAWTLVDDIMSKVSRWLKRIP